MKIQIMAPPAYYYYFFCLFGFLERHGTLNINVREYPLQVWLILILLKRSESEYLGFSAPSGILFSFFVQNLGAFPLKNVMFLLE